MRKILEREKKHEKETRAIIFYTRRCNNTCRNQDFNFKLFRSADARQVENEKKVRKIKNFPLKDLSSGIQRYEYEKFIKCLISEFVATLCKIIVQISFHLSR